MDDLISRLSELRCQYNCFDENERDAYHTLSEAIKAISAQPERKKGKWIATQEWGGRNYSCSCCKFSFIVDTCMLEPMWNFCPNCGAEIEGRR